MKDQLNKVEQFNKTYKVGEAPAKPTVLSHKETQLRFDLAFEELKEYEEAAHLGDLVEIADALGDQLYILCGTILRHGMSHIIEDVFNEIHASNMSKRDKNGNPIFREDGKVLKGENYFKPNLKRIVK
jgi:predicted HAD superfamily Cof-like phosphohydrolase